MVFYIVNKNGILPVKYQSWEAACADCEYGELVFIADDLETLEQSLDDPEELPC
ncbi:MAG: hypothetical protein ACM3PE_06100 [Deltaproteobacteria bacterium]